jgi:hypothetical protein
MVHEHALDLGRIHVVSAADVHLLQPTHDAQVPVRTHLAQIAGVEETIVVDDRGRRLGVLPVPLELRGGAAHDLARLVDPGAGAGLDVDDVQLHVGRGGADGRRDDFVGVAEVRSGRDAELSARVPDHHRAPERLSHAADQVRRDRRRADAGQSDP